MVAGVTEERSLPETPQNKTRVEKLLHLLKEPSMDTAIGSLITETEGQVAKLVLRPWPFFWMHEKLLRYSLKILQDCQAKILIVGLSRSVSQPPPSSSPDGPKKVSDRSQTLELHLVHLKAIGGAVSAACHSVTSRQGPSASRPSVRLPVGPAAGGFALQ